VTRKAITAQVVLLAAVSDLSAVQHKKPGASVGPPAAGAGLVQQGWRRGPCLVGVQQQ